MGVGMHVDDSQAIRAEYLGRTAYRPHFRARRYPTAGGGLTVTAAAVPRIVVCRKRPDSRRQVAPIRPCRKTPRSSTIQGMHRRPPILIAAGLLALALAAIAPSPAAAATAPPPRTALLYRINEVRVGHGLARVYPTLRLQRAAAHHSDDMMVRDYFSHTSPTGSSVYSRIVHSGFVSGYSWLGGETLAWGNGSLATPDSTVHAWLESPEHRAIMLSSKFHWIGISRTCGNYRGRPSTCVWTADWVKRW